MHVVTRSSKLVLLLLTALSLGAGAEGVATPQGPEDDQPFLMALRGQYVIINYAAGALDRAVHIQNRLELLASDFAKWTGESQQVRVFVLNRGQWRNFGFQVPYGLPGQVRGTTLAMPAVGDSGTVQLWTEVQGEPPPPLPGTPMKGTPVEAATLARADLMAEVEAARMLMSMGGVRGTPLWVHQVLAHLVARNEFTRYEQGRLSEINSFFESLASGLESPVGLENYAPGLNLATLMWFESRFQDGARVVMESGKRNEAKALVKLALKNGGALTEEMLFARHPEMKGWLARTFPSSGPS